MQEFFLSSVAFAPLGPSTHLMTVTTASIALALLADDAHIALFPSSSSSRDWLPFILCEVGCTSWIDGLDSQLPICWSWRWNLWDCLTPYPMLLPSWARLCLEPLLVKAGSQWSHLTMVFGTHLLSSFAFFGRIGGSGTCARSIIRSILASVRNPFENDHDVAA